MNTARVNNQDKYEILELVKNNRLTVSAGAEKLGISRQTLYSWLAQPVAPTQTEVQNTQRFDLRLDPRVEKNILATIKVSPQKGLRAQYEAVAAHLKNTSPSFHGFYNVLKRNNLLSSEAREKFSASSDSLTADFRKQIITRATQGENVSDLSKEYGLSRQSIYNWKHTFSRLGEGGLIRKSRSGRQRSSLTSEKTDLILQTIAAAPQFSVSGIYEYLKTTYPQLAIGRHAIYNLMKRHNLVTQTDRSIYASTQKVEPLVQPVSQTENVNAPLGVTLSPDKLPAPPPDTSRYPVTPDAVQYPALPVLSKIAAPEFPAPQAPQPHTKISRKEKLLIIFFGLITVSLYSFFSIHLVTSLMVVHSATEFIGFSFALIALTFGMLFLLYSTKYYVTSLWVLLFTRQANKNGGAVWQGRVGVKPNVSEVQLERAPFISIHVPLFNEKRVVNRLLDAVTRLEYENYEVIVCDDSTDETKDLVLEWKNHPKVKISHRENRDGFKGGALREAMKLVDPRTEFVMVFDADFLPFPDVIEQFLKYFQLSVGSLSPAHYSQSELAAIQGYQWHVLNKSENWVTRGVRTEYAGSYVLERTAAEIYGGLKQIAGSVFMIRADVLREFNWGNSITEDFELTLKLYQAGYRVMYSPYIQAPSECVSTVKRLIKQRMRWAEGHSFNTRRMFWSVLKSNKLSLFEKAEFLYLSPYYLQSFFFIAGTVAWFISEAIFRVKLPLWTAVWGWSLVVTNFLALPLMNAIGLFLEESEGRDFGGIPSFLALTYIVSPFQAFAAVKGFIENKEGPWIRTPKTGRITDTFKRGRISRWLYGIFAGSEDVTSGVKVKNIFRLPQFNFHLGKGMGNRVIAVMVLITILFTQFIPKVPNAQMAYASEPQLATVGETKKAQLEQGKAQEHTEKDPVNKTQIIENIEREEITGSRIISRTTKGGKQVDYIFSAEPQITVKLGQYEVEFVTKLLGGKVVHPTRSTILHDKEVLYSEVVPGVDLRYRLTNDLLVEEFIVKTPEAAKLLGSSIDQEVQGVGIQFVSPSAEAFGIYSKDGKEIFTLSQPFAEDAKHIKNADFKFELNKGFAGYTLTKKFGGSVQNWFASSEREYPIIIDPSVVVSGGIAEAETQFGGLQRKVVYVNSNWYAVYNDGTDVWYKKSADGVSWGAAQDIDSTDADNYNPTITYSGNFIFFSWVDVSLNGAEIRRMDATTDTLGTTCSAASSISTTFLTTMAAVSTTSVMIGVSDTGGASTVAGLAEVTTLDGTCAFTDRTTGNITFGTGITAQDRPVVVALNNGRFGVVFQDGDLSYSIFDNALDETVLNNLQIANVTDNVYSVTTDGTSMWVLTVTGTTATSLYKCCTDDWAETTIDSDAGANNQDGTSDIDMYCPTEDDCKIVYTDDIDTTAPILKFVDCANAACSSQDAVTSVDTDIGASGDQAGPSIYCPSATDCKIAYGDTMDTTTPLLSFADCNDAACSAPTITTNVDTDLGGATSILHTALDCTGGATDCKILYNDSGLSDMLFVDCPDAACTATGRTTTTLDGTAGTAPELDMDCAPGAADCKIVYHDTSATGGCLDAAALCFIDCGSATCTGVTVTAVDGDIGGTTDQPVVAIDCSAAATDCKIAYGDVTAGDAFFVDCPDAACTATGRTITTLDTTGGAAAQVFSKIDIDCVSATDCKVLYVGDVTSGTENAYFIDCDGAACATGSVVETAGPRFGGAVVCLTSTNCKLAYYEGTSGANPTMVFADCDVTNCFPSSSTLTAPWTSETNVTSVSITYDSSNSDLYAHVIKDNSEQAYWNSSDATTISWNGSTSYGFTAGDLGHISAPITGTGVTDIGVVVRQGTNFEFSVVPENLWLYLIGLPIYYLWKKLKRKKQYNHGAKS